MSKVNAVLARLEEADFQVKRGPVSPFGEEMPLVQAVAWDDESAQIALVAAQDELSDGMEPWRQLLFAVSGLRHQLRANHAPALATPVLFAVVDSGVVAGLRGLANELAESYSLFTRVELNIVSDDVSGEDLDVALAPMLLKVRKALKCGQTVAPVDVERFWERLNTEIREAAKDALAQASEQACDAAAERLIKAIAPNGSSIGMGKALAPISRLSLKSFRSFAAQNIPLATDAGSSSVTLIEGANGSGKSSIIEALELVWSGTTQRMPVGEKPSFYTKHTGRDGGEFRVEAELADGTPKTVSRVEQAPIDKLARAVLTQDAISRMASRRSEERFNVFLETSGLQVPELEERIKALTKDAQMALNRELDEVHIPPLAAANRNAGEHIRRHLRGELSAELPPLSDLTGAEVALKDVSDGAFVASDWSNQSDLSRALSTFDAACEAVAAKLDDPPPVGDHAVRAEGSLREAVSALRERSRQLGALITALGDSIPAPTELLGEESTPPLLPETAIRWYSQLTGLSESLPGLREALKEIDDSTWRTRLKRYVEALEKALKEVPADELRKLTRSVPRIDSAPSPAVPASLFAEVGFKRQLDKSPKLSAALIELREMTDRRADRLAEIANKLRDHPSQHFPKQARPIGAAVTYFELLRAMRLPNSPIARAKTSLVEDMLQERLFPLLRELVAALVRFEWYFEPMQLRVKRGQLGFEGLATSQQGLDIRLLLNAAERTVVGIGWFLALHLLQPEPERRVLVLDDPAGGLDVINRAGLVATLRSIVRLTRPEQLVITTHDPVLADLLEEELGAVAGWPTTLTRLRCQRDGQKASIVDQFETQASDADLEREKRVLGLTIPESPESLIR
jgi:hypothetical protein